METHRKEQLLRELQQLQDSADAIWRAVTNRWTQEQAASGENFMESLRKTVRSNVDFIRGLVEEPRLQAVRTDLVIADLEPFRQMAATGENWLAAPHNLIHLSLVRNGDELSEVRMVGEIDASTVTLEKSFDNWVWVLVSGNPTCYFKAWEGANDRYFVV